MLNKFLFLAAAVVSLSVSGFQANASSFYTSDHYFALFHFDAVAWGKAVRSVKVHTGVLEQAAFSDSGNGQYWADVQDILMVKVGDHFFAKAKLDGFSQSHNDSNLGPVVQYFVEFEDGTSMITNAVKISISGREDFSYVAPEDRMDKAESDFDSATDVDSTKAVQISVTEVG
jgi:hypothetical protein